MPVGNGHAQALRRNDGRARVHDGAVFDMPPDLQRFAFGFFFFAADIGDHVIQNFGHGFERLARAADRLIGGDRRRLYAVFHNGMQGGHVTLQRAVALDRDKAALCAQTLFLRVDDFRVIGVDLGNDHGHVGCRAVRGVVGNDGDLRLCVALFQRLDLLFFHIDRAEYEIDFFFDLLKIRFRVVDDHVREFFGDGGGHRPAFADRVFIFFPRGRGGSRQSGDAEPGVLRKQKTESLTDHSCRADDRDVVLFHIFLCSSKIFP